MMRPPRTNATPGDQQHDGNDDHDYDADCGDDDIFDSEICTRWTLFFLRKRHLRAKK